MSKNIPTNKALYARVKAEAKKKFDRWPSAYGSAWLVREYKKRGGGYRKAEMGMEVPEEYTYGGITYADSAYMYGGEDEYGYGGEDKYAKGGGIPQRYRNMGFTKVGVKKKSTRSGKKWMVLAKKGDKYKVVHGGFKGMKDFKQHGSSKRKKRFWDRMGGRDSAKAKDPFSPLYWHKRFGTWEAGGEFQPHMMYDPETGEGYEANKPEDHKRMAKLGYLHEDEMREAGKEMMAKYGKEMRAGGEYFNEDSMDFYAKGGTNNAGFKALPPQVQQKILDNMGIGGECYACGGQKKYQLGAETFSGIRKGVQAATDFMNGEMLDEVTVTDTRMGGLNPRPLPRFDVATPELNLMPMSNFVTPVSEPAADPVNRLVQSGEPQEGDSEVLDSRMMWAMGRIGMANAANAFMEANAARAKQAQMRTNFLSDNFVPMATGNDRGDYDINTGIFRPDDYVPTQFKAQFKQGGQMGMVDEETLKALIAAGADIELLD